MQTEVLSSEECMIREIFICERANFAEFGRRDGIRPDKGPNRCRECSRAAKTRALGRCGRSRAANPPAPGTHPPVFHQGPSEGRAARMPCGISRIETPAAARGREERAASARETGWPLPARSFACSVCAGRPEPAPWKLRPRTNGLLGATRMVRESLCEDGGGGVGARNPNWECHRERSLRTPVHGPWLRGAGDRGGWRAYPLRVA